MPQVSAETVPLVCLATERNKRKAEGIAAEYEAAGRNKRAAQQVRRTICSLHKEITGEDMPIIT